MTEENNLIISNAILISSNWLIIKAVRSSGPGGQNVNKTSTKAEIHFDFMNCPILTDELRQRLDEISRNRRDSEGKILVTSQKTRSFHANVADAKEKLRYLLLKALNPPKLRHPTAPSYTSEVKRLEQKRKRSEAKKRRREWKHTRNNE